MSDTNAPRTITDFVLAESEIESLRQQLADRDEQISDLTISSDTYFAERNSARDVWRRASKDRDELRQQLAHREKQIVMLRDGLKRADDLLRTSYDHVSPLIREALAATADLENVRLCEKGPVAWLNNGEAYPYPEGLPLYRAWRPKPCV